MKRIHCLIFIVFIIVSCTNKQKENFKDIQKVEKGMEIYEVENIMRHKPTKIEPAFWNDSLFIYLYDSPPAASDYYKIILSKKDSIVVEINYGD